jgi:hypothetical protein
MPSLSIFIIGTHTFFESWFILPEWIPDFVNSFGILGSEISKPKRLVSFILKNSIKNSFSLFL